MPRALAAPERADSARVRERERAERGGCEHRLLCGRVGGQSPRCHRVSQGPCEEGPEVPKDRT